MPPLSTYLADKLIRLEARAEAYSFPSSLFLALSTADPTEDASGLTEPSGGGYAREEVVRNTTNWSAGSDGTVANAVELVWPTATGDWGTITHIAIMDASTGGNMLRYFAIPNRTILSGGLFRVLVGLGTLSYKDEV